MKFVYLLLLLGLSFVSFSQQELVTYVLTSDGVGVDNIYISSTSFTSVNTNTLSFGTDGAYASGWPTDASITDYFEISITPNVGYKLNISEIDFGERRSSTGIRDYQVQWSVDNFTNSTTIATVNVPDDDNERSGDITSLSIDVADGETIKIRWYGYNAEGGAGTWRINNSTLKVLGTISNSSPVDADSKAEAPSTQISAINISSTVQTEAAAIDIFKFKLSDAGTADGKPTKVTLIRLYKKSGSQLLDNWIKGFVLKDGATYISIESVTGPGTAAYFDLNINSGDLVIDDGTSKELTVGVYLESTVVDNSSFSFYIDADNNNFTSDTLSSAFNSDFGTDVNSSVITITVEATKFYFSQQPSSTEQNSVMSPSPVIKYIDADNNIDADISGSSYAISFTTEGTFDGSSTTTVDPSSGVCTFSNIIHSDKADGIRLTATSADGSFSTVNSSLFSITETPENPHVDSLFISEVSDASAIGSEFLELYNVSSSPIDLTNISIHRMAADGTVQYTKAFSELTGDMTILSEGYVVISRGDDRTTFESTWASFPALSGFIEGNNNLYFGASTKYRWKITYNDGSKTVTTIDDTQDVRGGSSNTSNQLEKGSWTDYTSGSNSSPGQRNDNSELPISLVEFFAKSFNDYNKIYWTTNSEENNDFFSLERSNNAKDFNEIGIVTGAGNSNGLRNYSFRDNDIDENSELFYRLRQTDFDGKYTYSNIIIVNSVFSNLKLLNVYQDDNKIVIDIRNSIDENAIIRLCDASGKLVLKKSIKVEKGLSISRLEVSNINSGFYYISVLCEGSNEFISRKIVVIKK